MCVQNQHLLSLIFISTQIHSTCSFFLSLPILSITYIFLSRMTQVEYSDCHISIYKLNTSIVNIDPNTSVCLTLLLLCHSSSRQIIEPLFSHQIVTHSPFHIPLSLSKYSERVYPYASDDEEEEEERAWEWETRRRGGCV